MPAKITKGQKPAAHYTGVRRKLAEDSKLVFDMPLDVEDEFQSLYDNTGKSSNAVLAPPFNPVQLIAICTCNNILQQCIHVMEVNVDGTGHTIEPIVEGSDNKGADAGGDGSADKGMFPLDKAKPKAKDTATSRANDTEGEHAVEPVQKAGPDDTVVEVEDPEKTRAEDFFKEPFPGMSFVTMRRKLRVDIEQIGFGYLEVIRNPANEVLMLRYLAAQTIRLLRLDDAVMVTRTLKRDGKEIDVDIPLRERRYVQQVGNKTVYFKEFGCERDLDRTTGSWMEGTDSKGTPKKIDVKKKAGELLAFTVDRDSKTSYTVPRWINNLPSVLGSRKSEEFNLEFFDAGAVPPMLILIEGGVLTTTIREQLQAQLAGKKNQYRAAIVEISSASGSLDKPGQVGVKVERFGADRQQDAMFQKYDEACNEHVRIAFRLPSIFLGKEGSYNFATALVAYMIAEEQVFGPERREFDEIINNTIMKALECTNYKFVSKPITLKNADVMLQAVLEGKDFMSGQEFIKKLNEISGLNMEFDAAAAQKAADANDPFKKAEANAMAKGVPFGGGPGGGDPGARPASGLPNSRAGTGVKKSAADVLVDLVGDWMAATGMSDRAINVKDRLATIQKVERLPHEHRATFNRMVAMRVYSRDHDPEGLAELAGCCVAT